MKYMTVSAFALVIGLAACSGDDEGRRSGDLAPPPHVEALAPVVTTETTTVHTGLPVAQNRGLSTDVYFNEDLQQSIARLAGMEASLTSMQTELQGSAQAVSRIESMRREVEAMNVRLQSLQERLMYSGPAPVAALPPVAPVAGEVVAVQTTTTTAAPVAATLRPTPLMAEAPTPLVEAPKPVVEAKAEVKPIAPAMRDGVADVRIGTHAEKVRIVMDVGGKNLSYTANVDAAEKLLTVELPETDWNASKSETLKNNPLIASYTAQKSGKGTIVAFTLKADTKVMAQSTIKGNPSRLVIDLAR